MTYFYLSPYLCYSCFQQKREQRLKPMTNFVWPPQCAKHLPNLHIASSSMHACWLKFTNNPLASVQYEQLRVRVCVISPLLCMVCQVLHSITTLFFLSPPTPMVLFSEAASNLPIYTFWFFCLHRVVLTVWPAWHRDALSPEVKRFCWLLLWRN